MHPHEEEDRHCPMCNGIMAREDEEGTFICLRCRSRARFRGGELLAMKIPGYELRLDELQKRHTEVLALIEAESGRGNARDMRALRSLHEERQRILSEFSFLGYFRQFMERW